MSEETPNLIDAAVAAPEVADLLSAIFDHQQAERDHYQDLQESWWASERAAYKMTIHGVTWAANSCEFGGTTAQYESALRLILKIVHAANYGSDGQLGQIKKWYEETYTDPTQFTQDDVYPMFKLNGDF